MNPLLPTMMSIFCHFFNVWCTFFVILQLLSINIHNRMRSDQIKKWKVNISTKIEIVEFFQTSKGCSFISTFTNFRSQKRANFEVWTMRYEYPHVNEYFCLKNEAQSGGIHYAAYTVLFCYCYHRNILKFRILFFYCTLYRYIFQLLFMLIFISLHSH